MAQVILLANDKYQLLKDLFSDPMDTHDSSGMEQLLPTSPDEMMDIMKEFGIVFPGDD